MTCVELRIHTYVYTCTYVCMYVVRYTSRALIRIYAHMYVHTYKLQIVLICMKVSNRIGHWALYYNVIVLTRRPGH